MLDWLEAPQLRQLCHAGLNKSEQRHALAQVICTFKQGRIADRGPDAQQFRASGLNLVIVAIVHRNSMYLADAIDHLRSERHAVPAELLAHTSPLMWEHIGFSGDFLWDRAAATAGQTFALSVVSDNNRRSALYMAPPRCQAQSDATTQPRPSRQPGDQQPVGARSNAAAGYIRPSSVLIRKSAHREIGSDRGALDSARPADQNHQIPAGLRQCQGLANLKITRCAERRRISGGSDGGNDAAAHHAGGERWDTSGCAYGGAAAKQQPLHLHLQAAAVLDGDLSATDHPQSSTAEYSGDRLIRNGSDEWRLERAIVIGSSLRRHCERRHCQERCEANAHQFLTHVVLPDCRREIDWRAPSQSRAHIRETHLQADYLGLRSITVSRVKHSPHRCRPGTLSPLFRTLSCCQGRAPQPT
jgi:hypothetical protein